MAGEGGLEDTFTWNQRGALSNMLIMEEHYKDLDIKDVPHAWCITKHYLLACDHHVEEAIGHAERLGFDPKPYRRFRKKLQKLKAYPQPKFSLPQLIELRTEWRKIINDPTLVPDCPTCSADVTPDLLVDMQAINAHIPERIHRLEKKFTDDVLNVLAEEKQRPVPAYNIHDCDGDPTGKAYAISHEDGTPKIILCHGGVNAHTLAHEADHVWRHLDGECDLGDGNCPEDDAEEFALEELRLPQALNTHPIRGGSEKKMVSKGEIMGIYGACIGSKVVDKALEWADTQYPTGIAGQPMSTIGNLILGVVPPVMHLVVKKPLFKGSLELPAYIISGNAAANLAEDLYNKYLGGATAARVVRPTRTPTPQLGASKVAAF